MRQKTSGYCRNGEHAKEAVIKQLLQKGSEEAVTQ
jgi:hypothetical protein